MDEDMNLRVISFTHKAKRKESSILKWDDQQWILYTYISSMFLRELNELHVSKQLNFAAYWPDYF